MRAIETLAQYTAKPGTECLAEELGREGKAYQREATLWLPYLPISQPCFEIALNFYYSLNTILLYIIILVAGKGPLLENNFGGHDCSLRSSIFFRICRSQCSTVSMIHLVLLISFPVFSLLMEFLPSLLLCLSCGSHFRIFLTFTSTWSIMATSAFLCFNSHSPWFPQHFLDQAFIL